MSETDTARVALLKNMFLDKFGFRIKLARAYKKPPSPR